MLPEGSVALWPGLGFRRPTCVRSLRGSSAPPSHLKWPPSLPLLFCNCHSFKGQLCDPFPVSGTLPPPLPILAFFFFFWAGLTLYCWADWELPKGRPAPFLAPPEGPGDELEVSAKSNRITRGCQLQVETPGHPVSYEHKPRSQTPGLSPM